MCHDERHDEVKKSKSGREREWKRKRENGRVQGRTNGRTEIDSYELVID